MELVLAVSLLGLLFGALLLNLPGWSRARQLEAGSDRFETLLYMARADAANLGRRLRVAFRQDEQGTAQIELLWEADPLGAPEQFTAYSACTWLHYVPTGLVEVTSCQLQGQDAYRLMATGAAEALDSPEVTLDAVTFYPDGSCDSAVIELAAADPRDRRKVIIEIDGLTGSITRRVLTSVEAEEAEREELQ